MTERPDKAQLMEQGNHGNHAKEKTVLTVQQKIGRLASPSTKQMWVVCLKSRNMSFHESSVGCVELS